MYNGIKLIKMNVKKHHYDLFGKQIFILSTNFPQGYNNSKTRIMKMFAF